MANEHADWRLAGQEKYLHGRSLVRRKYERPRPDWDHDHCSFCHTKFMETAAPDVLEEGYATDDGSHWVCPPCFEDFKQRFAWTVVAER